MNAFDYVWIAMFLIFITAVGMIDTSLPIKIAIVTGVWLIMPLIKEGF